MNIFIMTKIDLSLIPWKDYKSMQNFINILGEKNLIGTQLMQKKSKIKKIK